MQPITNIVDIFLLFFCQILLPQHQRAKKRDKRKRGKSITEKILLLLKGAVSFLYHFLLRAVPRPPDAAVVLKRNRKIARKVLCQNSKKLPSVHR